MIFSNYLLDSRNCLKPVKPTVVHLSPSTSNNHVYRSTPQQQLSPIVLAENRYRELISWKSPIRSRQYNGP